MDVASSHHIGKAPRSAVLYEVSSFGQARADAGQFGADMTCAASETISEHLWLLKIIADAVCRLSDIMGESPQRVQVRGGVRRSPQSVTQR